MGLKNLQVPRVALPNGEGEPVMVRGLSFIDIKALFAQHQELALQAFDVIKAAQKNGVPGSDAMGGIVLRLLEEAPALAAGIIASAADEPEAMAMVFEMPIHWQASALEKIAELTFGEGEGLKKFGPVAMRALESMASEKS